MTAIDVEIAGDDTRFRAAAEQVAEMAAGVGHSSIPAGGRAAWRALGGDLVWVDLTGRQRPGSGHMGPAGAGGERGWWVLSGGLEPSHPYVQSTLGDRHGPRVCRRQIGTRYNIDGHLRTVWCSRQPGDPIHHPDRRYGWIDMPGLLNDWDYYDALAIVAGAK